MNTRGQLNASLSERDSDRVLNPDALSSETPSVSAARDETYALVSVLYHTLKSAETLTKYIEDAKRAGQTELVEFFEETRRMDQQRALKARRLLSQLLQKEDTQSSSDLEDDDDDVSI